MLSLGLTIPEIRSWASQGLDRLLLAPGSVSPRMTFARAQAGGDEATAFVDVPLTLLEPNAVGALPTFSRAQAGGDEATGRTA